MALAIPEGVWVLSSVSRLVGVEDPIRLLKEFQQLIDTDAVRRVASEVWGTTAAGSPTSATLDATGDRLVDEFLRVVESRWQGQTYQAFENYLTEVRSALRQEADSLPLVGAALIAVADGIELTWLEMIGAAFTAVSLILSAESLSTVVLSLLALIGFIVALGSAVVTYFAVITPRIELLARHETLLDRHGRNASSPVDALPSIDGRGAGWVPKTADPYS